jgi:hypothetical protein
MNKITNKAWNVFRSAFKNGDDVIVEDERGNFFYGKLAAYDDFVIITRPHGKSVTIKWDQIEFMAHDGFPVNRLMGMTPQEAATRAEQSNTKIITDLLDGQLKHHKVNFGGGCPFIVESVYLINVYNRGNTGPKFCYSDAGEVMTFQAKDGARMHNYDSDHLFPIP